MVKRTILVSGLVAMAAASLAQGLSGADLVPVVFNIAVSLVAAVVVLWTRRPTVGLIAAIWLSLGWALMPEYTLDNLRDPGNAGVFAGSVAQLVANAVALVGGAAAQLEHSRTARAVLGSTHEDELT
jgi:hypothetical protein